MPVFTNISTYKFAPLSDLKTLRQRLLDHCRAVGLKGTILLSTEGINLFVAGPRAQVDELVALIRDVPGLADLAPKFSESDHQPFSRMLVRIKKEIIAFGVPGIDPARRTSPKLPARTLKQWLDEGRKITLLDTRNDYEVKLGTFKNAVIAGIDTFREFPDAVSRLPSELKDEPIVMFCTGGIRCEKAGPFMEQQGFKNIFQLDGGILKYFEEVGGAHYDGECFVFDQRVGVDPALSETESMQCFKCLSPLTRKEQEHPHYQPPNACPHCFQTEAEKLTERIAARHAAIAHAATPLPGSIPYDNRRPLLVPAYCHGYSALGFLNTLFGHISREELAGIFSAQRILDIRDRPVSASHIVSSGEHYIHLIPGMIEPPVSADIRILHEDEALIVIHKPAPLPMHPGGRFNRNTLEHFLRAAYAPHRPRPAHRLDANTTGLVICARTSHMASLLQPQFASGVVEKTYLARVHGHPTENTFSCDAPITSEPGPTGSRDIAISDSHGLPARTEFRVLAHRASDDTTLLEALPITGRTNQIRIHLWSLGLPLCGDPTYLAAQKHGATQTLSPDDSPLCLHAWKITFSHPKTKARVTHEAPAPLWAAR